MSEKESAPNELEETVNRADEQLDLMAWKMDSVEQDLALPVDNQDLCVLNLLKSVAEVRQDYQQLKRELLEVQAMQRELSGRLRAQLNIVHKKFATLRHRLARVPPPR